MKLRAQHGVALLTAMLTVTLVATMASAALWQQWRSVEIEAAERSRTQMQWILNGTLDWARLILQEDARDGQVDHLSEPWSLPLQEARLSSFLALDKNNTDDAMEAFLSGRISDQQGLLNVRNLVTLQNGKPAASETAIKPFERLFAMLGLPRAQLKLLVDGLIATDDATTNAKPDSKANGTELSLLKPYRMEQLVWLGLSATTVRALLPYATLLPAPTPLNVNTASAEVLHVALPDLDMARARQLVVTRATTHFKSVSEAFKAAGLSEGVIGQADSKDFSVATRYFAVRGRLRLGNNSVQEVSLVERDNTLVKVIWRQREALNNALTASLQ